jgi:hypothetical protein
LTARTVDAGTFQTWYRGNAARLVRFFGGLTWCAGLSALAWALLASASSSVGQMSAMAAAALMVAAVAMFPLFFKQANVGFLAGGRSNDEMARAVRRWAMWHWVRTGISLGAFAVAVAAPQAVPVLSGPVLAAADQGAADHGALSGLVQMPSQASNSQRALQSLSPARAAWP